MHISELTFTVDRHGNIKIPASVLKKMGLFAGDHVRVAYLSKDGTVNSFREFTLSPDAIDTAASSEDDTIRIPTQLMEQANIAPDADLQIACLDGALVIFRDTGLHSEDLRPLLESMQAAEDLMSILPGDTQQTLLQLEQVIQTIQEGEEADESGE